MSRPRAAYRAIYLQAAGKFRTTLHAFERQYPQYVIEPWQKNPHAWHHWKFRASRTRKDQKFGQKRALPHGVEGLPDPATVGANNLALVAYQATAAEVTEVAFWSQLAERTRTVRDLMSPQDLVIVLDSLVFAEYRHPNLLKLLSRELVDDTNKLSLREIAVVANAYAHFSCSSKQLFQALAEQAKLTLEYEAQSDAITMLVDALARLNYHDPQLLQVASAAFATEAASSSFSDLAKFSMALSRFGSETLGNCSLGLGFYEEMTSKAPGFHKVRGGMAFLCPALSSLSSLGTELLSTLRAALVLEITEGLKAEEMTAITGAGIPGPGLMPAGTALGLWKEQRDSFPPFTSPAIAPPFDQSMFPEKKLEDSNTTTETSETDVMDFEMEFGEQSVELDDEDDVDQESQRVQQRFWYDPVRRAAAGSPVGYTAYDPGDMQSRNRVGALVSQALCGINTLWQCEIRQRQGSSDAAEVDVFSNAAHLEGEVFDAEDDLLDAAAPVLNAALPGLNGSQLVGCAEVYALQGLRRNISNEAMLRSIVHEALRKLRAFQPAQLLQLEGALRAAGLHDAYFTHARKRHFPISIRSRKIRLNG